ncbi:uncharacterized protein DDB_G0271670 isoform X2 [Patella vulgata]|uniref:uncharacterized protein DDB_G0271670 isoform X2 n=1 Tax=Patella vulgata TaxID=6465 RepID=UPI0021806685|nr:uncharacterized protein DDB_G0271670 isoform X2 [Patella vulgata]
MAACTAHMLYIYIVFTVGYTTGIDITVCKEGGNFPSVNLNCPTNDDMIHVESIVYFYNQGSSCGGSTEICGQPLTNSDTGLITSCIGQPSPCSQFISNYSNCTGSTVNYRCISRENGQDICQSKTNLSDNSARIYLLSPNYPTAASGFNLNEIGCECFIRSTTITFITILDLVLKTSKDGTRSNLFIQYGDITYNRTSNRQSSLLDYNHRLQTTTQTAEIIFTHQQINGLKLWIEIQGISLTGFCNNTRATTVTPTPTTPFTSPPRPDSTTTRSGISTSTTTVNSRPSSTVADPSTSSETSSTTTVNSRPSSTTTDPSTSSETSSQTTTNPLDSTTRSGISTSTTTVNSRPSSTVADPSTSSETSSTTTVNSRPSNTTTDPSTSSETSSQTTTNPLDSTTQYTDNNGKMSLDIDKFDWI